MLKTIDFIYVLTIFNYYYIILILYNNLFIIIKFLFLF